MPDQRTAIDELAVEDFLGAQVWREEGLIHIDVSDLPAPDPFVAVMRLLEWPDVGDQIIFHNDLKPVHLFPELLDQGWGYRTEVDRPGVFRMSVFRESSS
jgi:hypothetical protein